MIKPCLGGWCKRREACPNYTTPVRNNPAYPPAERLCGPQDGVLKPAPQHGKPDDRV